MNESRRTSTLEWMNQSFHTGTNSEWVIIIETRRPLPMTRRGGKNQYNDPRCCWCDTEHIVCMVLYQDSKQRRMKQDTILSIDSLDNMYDAYSNEWIQMCTIHTTLLNSGMNYYAFRSSIRTIRVKTVLIDRCCVQITVFCMAWHSTSDERRGKESNK